MEQIEEIRRLEDQGVARVRIAARLGVSRSTVSKYADQEVFVARVPVPRRRVGGSVLEPFIPVIDEILELDKLVWRKQRHTAKRIFERLRDEHGYQAGRSVVERYVRAWKEQDRVRSESGGFNRLEWAPGTAQVDFGEADFQEGTGLTRMSYLTVSFPFSNQGFSQVFRGETAECVCQGLLDVFTAIGGVPTLLVFDNATGVGRRIGEVVRETELFRLFRLHHRFDVRFCNPYSGHEKGHVENKVGTTRRNLFVPIPKVEDLRVFNQALLIDAVDDDAVHYRKQDKIVVLFAQDQKRLFALPGTVFEVVRWADYATDKYGIVTVDGVHEYSVSPQMPLTRVVVGFRAHEVEIFTLDGTRVATHARLFGKRRSSSMDQLTMMTALIRKPGAWHQSGFRTQMPAGPGRVFLDGLDKHTLSQWLESIRDQALISGLAETQEALDWLAAQRVGFTAADLAAVTHRAAGFGLDRTPDHGPDLACYDQAFLNAQVMV